MSADSEPPADPPPTPPSSPESTAPGAEEAAAPEYLPQKRRHKKPEPAEFDFSEGTDDEILILGTLLQRLLARKQAETSEPETRSKINRFVQKNTTQLGAAPGVTGTSDGDPSTAAESEAGAPSKPLPQVAAARDCGVGRQPLGHAQRPGTGQSFILPSAPGWPSRRFWWAGVRPTRRQTRVSPTPPLPPRRPPQWNATLLGKLDQVLAADQKGELQSAKAQAVDLKKQIGNSLELDLYIGSLTTRLGHMNDAEADLSRLLEPYMQPLQAAAVNESMAFTYTRRRDFKRAAEAFADATRIDPFEPNNYYRWGEVAAASGPAPGRDRQVPPSASASPRGGGREREPARVCRVQAAAGAD